MNSKIVILLHLLVIYSLFAVTADGGPFTYAACYSTCTAACWAGAYGSVMVLGFAGPIYGAAACSSFCSAVCAVTAVAPTL